MQCEQSDCVQTIVVKVHSVECRSLPTDGEAPTAMSPQLPDVVEICNVFYTA